MNVYYSPLFKKQYRKIPKSIQSLAEKKEVIFRKNQSDPRLKTHPLIGKMDGMSSFSVNYSYRIVFETLNNGDVWFISIGTHEIYK